VYVREIEMKKQGHYCRICGRHRANEKFSGKGHAKHICKDCDREHRAKLREQKRELNSRVVFVQVLRGRSGKSL
jgi:transposase-like protein